MSETLQTIVMATHIMLGIILVAIILIQRGKGSDAGMAFGGGASGTVFGASGSGTFLTKTTKWLFIGFVCTSLALAYVHNNSRAPSSILDNVEEVTQDGDVLPNVAPLPEGISSTGNLDGLPKVEIISPEGVSVTATPAVTIDPQAAELPEASEVVDQAGQVIEDATEAVDQKIDSE